MTSLPEGWESDYDGSRWFFRYKPTGAVQFMFPKPGDEFPEYFDNFGPVAQSYIPTPEESLESDRQRRMSGLPPRRTASTASRTGAASKEPTSATLGRSDFLNSSSFDMFGGFLGPASYTDVSPLYEDEEDPDLKAVDDPTQRGIAEVDSTPASTLTTPNLVNSIATESADTTAAAAAAATTTLPPNTEPVIIHELPDALALGGRHYASDPVGNISELATEQTPLAEEESNPPPVELDSGPIPPGPAELPHEPIVTTAAPIAPPPVAATAAEPNEATTASAEKPPASDDTGTTPPPQPTPTPVASVSVLPAQASASQTSEKKDIVGTAPAQATQEGTEGAELATPQAGTKDVQDSQPELMPAPLRLSRQGSPASLASPLSMPAVPNTPKSTPAVINQIAQALAPNNSASFGLTAANEAIPAPLQPRSPPPQASTSAFSILSTSETSSSMLPPAPATGTSGAGPALPPPLGVVVGSESAPSSKEISAPAPPTGTDTVAHVVSQPPPPTPVVMSANFASTAPKLMSPVNTPPPVAGPTRVPSVKAPPSGLASIAEASSGLILAAEEHQTPQPQAQPPAAAPPQVQLSSPTSTFAATPSATPPPIVTATQPPLQNRIQRKPTVQRKAVGGGSGDASPRSASAQSPQLTASAVPGTSSGPGPGPGPTILPHRMSVSSVSNQQWGVAVDQLGQQPIQPIQSIALQQSPASAPAQPASFTADQQRVHTPAQSIHSVHSVPSQSSPQQTHQSPALSVNSMHRNSVAGSVTTPSPSAQQTQPVPQRMSMYAAPGQIPSPMAGVAQPALAGYNPQAFHPPVQPLQAVQQPQSLPQSQPGQSGVASQAFPGALQQFQPVPGTNPGQQAHPAHRMSLPGQLPSQQTQQPFFPGPPLAMGGIPPPLPNRFATPQQTGQQGQIPHPAQAPVPAAAPGAQVTLSTAGIPLAAGTQNPQPPPLHHSQTAPAAVPQVHSQLPQQVQQPQHTLSPGFTHPQHAQTMPLPGQQVPGQPQPAQPQQPAQQLFVMGPNGVLVPYQPQAQQQFATAPGQAPGQVHTAPAPGPAYRPFAAPPTAPTGTAPQRGQMTVGTAPNRPGAVASPSPTTNNANSGGSGSGLFSKLMKNPAVKRTAFAIGGALVGESIGMSGAAGARIGTTAYSTHQQYKRQSSQQDAMQQAVQKAQADAAEAQRQAQIQIQQAKQQAEAQIYAARQMAATGAPPPLHTTHTAPGQMQHGVPPGGTPSQAAPVTPQQPYIPGQPVASVQPAPSQAAPGQAAPGQQVPGQPLPGQAGRPPMPTSFSAPPGQVPHAAAPGMPAQTPPGFAPGGAPPGMRAVPVAAPGAAPGATPGAVPGAAPGIASGFLEWSLELSLGLLRGLLVLLFLVPLLVPFQRLLLLDLNHTFLVLQPQLPNFNLRATERLAVVAPQVLAVVPQVLAVVPQVLAAVRPVLAVATVQHLAPVVAMVPVSRQVVAVALWYNQQANNPYEAILQQQQQQSNQFMNILQQSQAQTNNNFMNILQQQTQNQPTFLLPTTTPAVPVFDINSNTQINIDVNNTSGVGGWGDSVNYSGDDWGADTGDAGADTGADFGGDFGDTGGDF
ncbi:hypothetical protein SPBR_01190 [Sporothrix brasiliensis 5110]|uniref:WW domain-containing protein n=1 Tax=Sporothrix brasiliensis 5110 TaxID=1398154 RepID=A0A0C2IWF1_9PEZI|nr:uncharacterized protein SPBR_01190 [Sporothrix brasiliensis 5110]KIH91105.1 hypothetical protein SPBR_01190 [Sporothrix brasiliensis 5110]